MPLDILIQLVMTAVSMGIAIFALRGFRWVKERSLYYLYIAFTLLAIGFFANGLTLGYDFIEKASGSPFLPPHVFVDLGFSLYYIFSMVAFAILVYAYFRNVRDASIAVAAFGVLLTASAPFMESVNIVLLFMIVFAQLIHLSIRSSRSAIMVCTSFALMLASHILILISSDDSEIFYVIGKLILLLAFCLLLWLLLKMRGPE